MDMRKLFAPASLLVAAHCASPPHDLLDAAQQGKLPDLLNGPTQDDSAAPASVTGTLPGIGALRFVVDGKTFTCGVDHVEGSLTAPVKWNPTDSLISRYIKLADGGGDSFMYQVGTHKEGVVIYRLNGQTITGTSEDGSTIPVTGDQQQAVLKGFSVVHDACTTLVDDTRSAFADTKAGILQAHRPMNVRLGSQTMVRTAYVSGDPSPWHPQP